MACSLVCPQNLCLHLLQFRSNEALPANGCLLPGIVRRHTAEIRFRDLNEIAEDGIEPHLERFNSSGGDFTLLQGIDPILALARSIAQLVELPIKTVTENSAFFQRQRRVV